MKREEEFRGSGHTHVILSTCSPNYGDVGMPHCIIAPSQNSKTNFIWLELLLFYSATPSQPTLNAAKY